ncbi:Protein CBG03112 [Caenorhabditis briggsae]|uniref:Protein CBG03112 n=1 Tax=Caenorhabditis briggsae TaxID=6238 RepID=A8WSR8_CAEBR|nr:Protein CBG03112 [Caenorhabditis briggsae]CAP23527.1 Protein CBG03112 [Caenorhabditis briggsae]
MAPKPNPPPKEDTWAFQPIGSPFPPIPVKCMGEQNMYVALWYKHGKPIHGRSWNNGGVVECSFPYKEAELITKQQLEGQIQVLHKGSSDGNNAFSGFWYEWIKYKDRIEKLDDKHQLVRCGDSFPIFWKRKEGNLLGYVDSKTEEAWFSFNGKVIKQVGPQLSDMHIITRNCIGGPPHCECDNCPKPPPPPPIPPPGPPPPRVVHDEWIDIREGDPFPTRKLVQALDKSLDTLPGVNPDQLLPTSPGSTMSTARMSVLSNCLFVLDHMSLDTSTDGFYSQKQPHSKLERPGNQFTSTTIREIFPSLPRLMFVTSLTDTDTEERKCLHVDQHVPRPSLFSAVKLFQDTSLTDRKRQERDVHNPIEVIHDCF